MITASKAQNWRTPLAVFLALHREYKFTIDCASSISNHLLPRYWTRAHNALRRSMHGERGFCNPPFGMLYEFLTWGYEHCQLRGEGSITFLVPGNYETAWFRDLATLGDKELYHRRVAYVAPPGVKVSQPSFASMLVHYGPDVVPSGINFSRMRDGVTGEVIDFPVPTPLQRARSHSHKIARLTSADVLASAQDVVYGGAAADVSRFTLNPKQETFKIELKDRGAWAQATAPGAMFAP